MFAFLEMVIFLFILGVGYVYIWLQGDLDWDKPEPVVPAFHNTFVFLFKKILRLHGFIR